MHLSINILEGKPDGVADYAAQQQLQQQLTTSQDRVQELQQHADEQSEAWYIQIGTSASTAFASSFSGCMSAWYTSQDETLMTTHDLQTASLVCSACAYKLLGFCTLDG